jgi:hypothetical protein
MEKNDEKYENNFEEIIDQGEEDNYADNHIPIQKNTKFCSNQEEKVIWDLEIWKRAEQTKFKAYLKQLEYEFLSKLSEDFKQKEDEREKDFKTKINELNILQTRLKKKATELETRENKLTLLEEELKIKMNEVARQLANKEEEIVYYNKRFKEAKIQLEKDKISLQKIIQEKENDYQKLEIQFKNFKKEIDDSPLSVIKSELNKKNLEIEDYLKNLERINSDKEKYKQQCEKLKIELIKIKKLFESEKEQVFKQKIDEVEKLKFEIYNQKVSQNELNELKELRMKIKEMSENVNTNNQNVNVDNNNILMKKEYKIVNIKKRNYYMNKNENFDARNEIERLQQEKVNLLNSGMYQEDDKLIIQIDNRIRRMLNDYEGENY